MKRFLRNYEALLTLFITLIGLTGLLYFQFMMEPGPTGPLIFPKLSCFILLIFGSLATIDVLGQKYEDSYPELNLFSVTLFEILLILYNILFLKIGIIVASFLFFFISFNILSPKGIPNLKTNIIYSISSVIFIWIIFIKIFNIILPQYLLF